jgi:hypothetical protein
MASRPFPNGLNSGKMMQSPIVFCPGAMIMGPRSLRLVVTAALTALLLGSHAAAAEERIGSIGRAVYDTPVDGLTALSRSLLDYWSRGANTIEEIFRRRSSDYDRAAAEMVHRVASKLGVAAIQPLDLRDPSIHIPLVKAIIHEEGTDTGSPYGPQDYEEALRRALQARGLQAISTTPGGH